jgi:NitT/TauT family transport system substrate-binding protein
MSPKSPDSLARIVESLWTEMPKAKRWLMGLVPLALLVTVTATSCYLFRKSRPVPPATVRIGIATWPGFASGMIGKEKGFFQDIDLQYRTIDDLNARHAAFSSGDLDIMISSIDLWVQERSQGLDGKAFIVTDESAGGDGIVAKPNIKTASDLRGKKVAFARATPSHYLLFKVLEKAGLTPNDITQVKVEDPGNAGQAFLGGSVDAAVTWEPFLTQVKESSSGHVLATSKEFPGIIVDVLVASPKLLNQPEVLDRFIRGWLQSVEYIKANPNESARIIAKGLNTKEDDIQGMMAGLQFANADRNRYFFCSENPSTSPLSSIIKDAGGFWKQQGIIPNVPESDNILTPRICQTLNAQSGGGK